MSIQTASDATFAELVNSSEKPVLVDFWAEWCGPCKQLAPVLDQIEAEFGDQITVVKMNVDDNPSTPSKLGVMGIPTMVVFADGAEAARIVGAKPKAALVQALDEFLA